MRFMGHGDVDNVPNINTAINLMCYLLFLQYRVSDQTSKASAIGATNHFKNQRLRHTRYKKIIDNTLG